MIYNMPGWFVGRKNHPTKYSPKMALFQRYIVSFQNCLNYTFHQTVISLVAHL